MDPWIYIWFFCLFLLSWFFSATEIAFMSIPVHKVDSLVKQKKFGSRILSKLKKNSDKVLITALIGNNLVNTYAAALATQISIDLARASGMEESLAIGIATGLITFLILVFCEIVPKSFASKNAELISLTAAPIYKFLIFFLTPAIFIFEIMIRIFTGKKVSSQITEEEIETFIDLWKDSGTLEDEDHERLKNTLEFSDTLVEEVMVPRVKMDSLSDDYTIDEALEYYMTHTHSRIPVYHETVDNVIGIVTIRDLLRETKAWNGEKMLQKLHFKKCIKVPLNQPIDILLDTFKTTRQHMAIVIDEYGGVAGIITIEDIIEEVFWEIHDETDFETDEIIEKSKNVFVIHSSILLHDIVDEFDLEISDLGMDEKEFWSETVSYIITHELERFPEKDEEICFPIQSKGEKKHEDYSLCFKVLEIEDNTIGRIEVFKKVILKAIEK